MSNLYRKGLVIALILFFQTNLHAINQLEKKIVQIQVETVNDKIRGGLLGQILGNLNGIPREMKHTEEPGSAETYTPSLPNGAWTDDDTDFEWAYICEMQKHRNVFLSSEEITRLWIERINNRIWCSNRYARYVLVLQNRSF